MAALLSVGIAGGGCYTKNIEEAFDGDFPPEENNRVIIEYCKSCHTHKDFNPGSHVETEVLAYKRKVFRFAEECRVCHYLEKKFSLNDFTRKTRKPEDANRGKFRSFERKTLEYQKERKTPKDNS